MPYTLANGSSPVSAPGLHRRKNAYRRISVNRSGFRFYHSGIGRWCSRDPLGDYASMGSRELHEKLSAQMKMAATRELKIAQDESVDFVRRFVALAEAIYWMEGIRVLQSGDPSFSKRWYNPLAGVRFSRDLIGISGGLDQYVFCGDDPVNLVDPTGEDMVAVGGGANINLVFLHGSISLQFTWSDSGIGMRFSLQGGVGLGFGGAAGIVVSGSEACPTPGRSTAPDTVGLSAGLPFILGVDVSDPGSRTYETTVFAGRGVRLPASTPIEGHWDMHGLIWSGNFINW